MATVSLGEVGTDPGAHSRVVAVFWHVDEQRDEAAKPIRSRQHPQARPIGKACNRQGEVGQPVEVDLKQLVARIGLQHREQAAPCMARRVEASAIGRCHHLAAQDWHLVGGTGVSGGREQTHHPHLARQLAVR